MQEITVPAGSIRYQDEGSSTDGAPTLLFVHGVFMNHLAWRKVVPPLAGEFRCIAPDWPLGSHTIPMNDDADLSPRGKRIRENGRRFVRGIDYGDLPRAAEKLRFFEKPVLILWAREDRLFPYAFAERWMTVLPNARLVPVPDSYTYVAEDQPEFVSREIAGFAREVGAHADT